MCEFLEFDGADFRHAPPNAGGDDLLTMWKAKPQPPRRGLPSRAKGPIRAQLRQPDLVRQPESKRELGWSGGKAGS
jgi:hypothetical protein